MQPSNPYQAPSQRSAAYPAKPGIKDTLFSFQGRIPRRTYWLWTIIVLVIWYAVVFSVFGSSMVAEASATPSMRAAAPPPPEPSAGSWLLLLVVAIPVFWISLAVQAKRWHDRDKSGWWVLINIVPLLGIWTFIECGCLRGSHGSNRFGSDPT